MSDDGIRRIGLGMTVEATHVQGDPLIYSDALVDRLREAVEAQGGYLAVKHPITGELVIYMLRWTSVIAMPDTAVSLAREPAEDGENLLHLVQRYATYVHEAYALPRYEADRRAGAVYAEIEERVRRMRTDLGLDPSTGKRS